jgi:Cft2 family RNA processing exonuclease
VLKWKNIKIYNNFEQLEAEVKDGKPKIFCVPSGMMSAGYSVYVATELLPRSNNCIIFCGYSAENTLSWKIKQKKTKTITIDGKSIHSRCQVANLVSFSSHI